MRKLPAEQRRTEYGVVLFFRAVDEVFVPYGLQQQDPYHFKQKLAMVRFIVEMCLVASFMIMRAKPLSPYILPAMSFSHTMPF